MQRVSRWFTALWSGWRWRGVEESGNTFGAAARWDWRVRGRGWAEWLSGQSGHLGRAQWAWGQRGRESRRGREGGRERGRVYLERQSGSLCGGVGRLANAHVLVDWTEWLWIWSSCIPSWNGRVGWKMICSCVCRLVVDIYCIIYDLSW